MNDYEHRKICMARYLYRNSLFDEATPSSRKKKTFSKGWQTWAMWWESRFGDNINEYIEEMSRVRAKQNK